MRRDEARLRDMLDAARDAVAFAEPLTFEEFVSNRLYQYAIIKAIEIIGEAATKLDAETRSAYPDIPWGQIRGMRNRMVHEYYDIQADRVWATVQDDLPTLIARLEEIAPGARP